MTNLTHSSPVTLCMAHARHSKWILCPLFHPLLDHVYVYTQIPSENSKFFCHPVYSTLQTTAHEFCVLGSTRCWLKHTMTNVTTANIVSFGSSLKNCCGHITLFLYNHTIVWLQFSCYPVHVTQYCALDSIPLWLKYIYSALVSFFLTFSSLHGYIVTIMWSTTSILAHLVISFHVQVK